MEFQTRSEANGLRNTETFAQALELAKADRSIWKISFTISETGERIRLVKLPAPDDAEPRFYYEPLLDHLGRTLDQFYRSLPD